MDKQSIEERKRIALEAFGRELTTEQVIALGPRIDAAVRNVAILTAWEEKLGQTEPAAVHIVANGDTRDE